MREQSSRSLHPIPIHNTALLAYIKDNIPDDIGDNNINGVDEEDMKDDTEIVLANDSCMDPDLEHPVLEGMNHDVMNYYVCIICILFSFPCLYLVALYHSVGCIKLAIIRV